MAEQDVQRTPEHDHLAEQLRLLDELTEQLATKEADFATIGAEFASFRVAYLTRFAALYSELDRLAAEIARLAAVRLRSARTESDAYGERVEAAEAKAEEAEARAAQSASAGDSAEAERPPSLAPTVSLRALYREVAKAVHPDLATDAAEQVRRTRLMSNASEAYAAGDEAALRRILAGEAARPEAVAGDDVGSRLVRVLRQIAQVRGRLTELVKLQNTLEDDPMWTLFELVRAATGHGEDPLRETEALLKTQIRSARSQLAALRMDSAPLA